jgi:hypothetical protein
LGQAGWCRQTGAGRKNVASRGRGRPMEADAANKQWKAGRGRHTKPAISRGKQGRQSEAGKQRHGGKGRQGREAKAGRCRQADEGRGTGRGSLDKPEADVGAGRETDRQGQGGRIKKTGRQSGRDIQEHAGAGRQGQAREGPAITWAGKSRQVER